MTGSKSSSRNWIGAGLDEASLQALREGLPATRLWSLLLDVMEHRARQRTPASLTDQWTRGGFTAPAPVDQRTLHAIDRCLLDAAAGFEALELSPLAPLGVCSAVGLASQNKVVSALRGTEVVSDPTNVLALECAHRLRDDPSRVVRLATSHRCVRAQEVPRQAGFAPHFRMFCLVSAGREEQDHAVVVREIVVHISALLDAMNRLEALDYHFPDRVVTVLASDTRAAAGDRVAAAVPGARRARLEHPYYDGLRFQIQARTASGSPVPLVDGGAFDWVGRLAANRRLVYIASAIGSQIVATQYRRPADA